MTIQALKPGITKTLSPNAGSVRAQVGESITMIRVTSDSEVQIVIGRDATLVATANDMDHPASPHVEYYMIAPEGYLAVFSSGSATVKMTEMSK